MKIGGASAPLVDPTNDLSARCQLNRIGGAVKRICGSSCVGTPAGLSRACAPNRNIRQAHFAHHENRHFFNRKNAGGSAVTIQSLKLLRTRVRPAGSRWCIGARPFALVARDGGLHTRTKTIVDVMAFAFISRPDNRLARCDVSAQSSDPGFLRGTGFRPDSNHLVGARQFIVSLLTKDEPSHAGLQTANAVSRRGFLQAGAAAGGGLMLS